MYDVERAEIELPKPLDRLGKPRDQLQRLSAERYESLDQVIAYGLSLIEKERRDRGAGVREQREAQDLYSA